MGYKHNARVKPEVRCSTYNVGKEEPRVAQLEVFEERVELEAVEAAPGTVEVLPGLGLLSAVVVVQELINYPRHLIHITY